MATRPFTNFRVLIGPLLFFSLVTNGAILISPIFMMQVLDRVVPSGNLSTLILLLIMALAALCVSSAVELNRDIALRRVARWAEDSFSAPILRLPAKDQTEHFRLLGLVRGYLLSGSATALLNAVWLPLFIVALALINLNYVLLVGLVSAGVVLSRLGRRNIAQGPASETENLRAQERRWTKLLETLAIAVVPQHLRTNIGDRLQQAQTQRHTSENRAEVPEQAFKTFGTLCKSSVQLFALSIGAFLVSRGQLSAGAMIAASLIASKAVVAVDQALDAVGAWPEFRRATETLCALPHGAAPGTHVADLSGALTCDRLIYPRGGGAPPRLDRISFELKPGTCLAIIGDAGSGKSTLLNALAGLDPAPIGNVTLDQTDVRHMDPQSRQKNIGHIGQLGGLMPGTVAENIAGFAPAPEPQQVIAAAKRARVHGLISALPEGYQTDLAKHPYLLTAGQRQQIALACALFSEPRYLFLDEPNALLDKNAERAFCETIATLKEAGVTVVMTLHRAGVIGLADHVLVMERGCTADFGPRSQVLGRRNDGRRLTKLPLRRTSIQDLSDWITGQFTRAGDADFASKTATIGGEMFLAASLNGPQDKPREAEVEFRFIDDNTCEIQLLERGTTGADRLLRQIKADIARGLPDAKRYEEKAMPLMLAHKMAASLEVTNANNLSKFTAKILNETPADDGARLN